MKYVLMLCTGIGLLVMGVLAGLLLIGLFNDIRFFIRNLWRRTYLWQYYEYKKFVRTCINDYSIETVRILEVLKEPYNANRIYLKKMYELTYRRDLEMKIIQSQKYIIGTRWGQYEFKPKK